jgi:hypothetical protein
MVKKSILSLIVTAIFLSFAVNARAQDLEIMQSAISVCPLVILNARRTDEGLSVEVQNTSMFPVEYFELHMERSRVWAGRNSLTERLLTHPKNLEQAELHLAPQEVRTFQFPTRGQGNSIKVEIVLLSNGQGWTQDIWLKKLEKPSERGMLWGVDKEESEKHWIRKIAK